MKTSISSFFKGPKLEKNAVPSSESWFIGSVIKQISNKLQKKKCWSERDRELNNKLLMLEADVERLRIDNDLLRSYLLCLLNYNIIKSIIMIIINIINLLRFFVSRIIMSLRY